MSEAERISGCPPGPKSLTEKPAKIKRTFRANFSNWVSLSPPAANRKRMQTYPSQHVSSFQPRPPGMIILTFIFSFIPYQKNRPLEWLELFLLWLKGQVYHVHVDIDEVLIVQIVIITERKIIFSQEYVIADIT